MGKFFSQATAQPELYNAWRHIRENGFSSQSEEVRNAVELFERQTNRNIFRIQKRLRDGTFEFEPQIGILKPKSSGGHRGIVMASVYNRIVERALLEALQTRCQFVKDVISHPTSVGGVPERSVPHGLKLINDAFDSGNKYFIRSDISGFFDSIVREDVIRSLEPKINDDLFVSVLRNATKVTLANEKTLGEDRSIFPTNEEGVAQGSPLSPLFGNILLYEFDLKMNGAGVICVRFIDDFILLSREERKVRKAFQSAKSHLTTLGLKCHDPFDVNADVEKASFGEVQKGFVFLGYDIRPGIFQPSEKARKKLEKTIDQRIRSGKSAIIDAKNRSPRSENSSRYVQTLSSVDRILRGWGNSFAYGTSRNTIEQLDIAIDKRLDDFRIWFAHQMRDQDWKTRRRAGGVGLLSDIEPKSLDDVPFKLAAGSRFRQSSRTLTISTDGSSRSGRRLGKDRGVGGWAFVIHETGYEKFGHAAEVTNNEMELTAVVEALKHAPKDKSLRIRTDSQYVVGIVNRRDTVKSNRSLWQEYSLLAEGRSLKFEWVKGHSGDPHNERADYLATESAKSGFASR